MGKNMKWDRPEFFKQTFPVWTADSAQDMSLLVRASKARKKAEIKLENIRLMKLFNK